MAATEQKKPAMGLRRNSVNPGHKSQAIPLPACKGVDWEALLVSTALFLGNQLLEKLLIFQFAAGDHQMCKLDCVWYQGIAMNGYTSVNPEHINYTKMQNWAFFPLLPVFAGFLVRSLSLKPETATILAAKLFFFLSIYFFILLAKTYIKNANSFVPGLIVAFNPYSIYGNAGYTESLFLMLTCLFFYQLKRGNYFLTGIFGFCLPLTRLVGISAFPALALQIWSQRQGLRGKKLLAALIALFSIPAGLLLFMGHLYQQTGDPLAFVHIQRAWRGSESSPSPIGWFFSLVNGLNNKSLWLYPYWSTTGIIILIACIVILCNRNTKNSPARPLALFSLVCTLLPLSSDAWGLSRYVWWQAPVLLAICYLIVRQGRPKLQLTIWAIIALIGNIYCYHQWFTPLKWHIA